MEVKSAQFASHVAKISAILQDECKAPGTGHLAIAQDFKITIPAGPTPPFLKVTTDLGRIESALELPIAIQRHQRRYWVGLNENWTQVSKHKIRFHGCSLRLYVGSTNQAPAHFLRLEWMAPEAHTGAYQGKHAGHPHWHIDRTVLAGNKALSLPLEDPAPNQNPELEEFSALTVSEVPSGEGLIDGLWIQKVHLPAQAGWMKKWIGTSIPGPHQCEPDNLGELENWWTGALRYFVHELSNLRI